MDNMKKTILTGDRPTGQLHLGHYVGSLKSRLKFQNDYDTIILIANIQALTDNFDNPKKVSENILEVLKDYISVGLDPNLVTFVLQSDISEIAELTVLYSNLVTISRLMRNPTVKSEIIEKKNKFSNDLITLGFLGYPVSQAADITAFMADLVPVGEDQAPMLEQTIEIVKKFNNIYGNILKVPKIYISDVPRLVGLDGKSKMSKSIGNTINFSDTTNIIKNKIMSMYTDPNRIHKNDPGNVEGNPVFIYHNIFNSNKEEVKDLESRYRIGRVGDVEVKEKLFKVIEEFISPIRERRLSLEGKDKYLFEILKSGTKRGRDIASKTLYNVKNSMDLNFLEN
jgi:tryptophanyl-tRNA synthetase